MPTIDLEELFDLDVQDLPMEELLEGPSMQASASFSCNVTSNCQTSFCN